MNNILEYLEKTAEKSAWGTGIDDGKVFLSWKELMELSKRIGTAFAKRIAPKNPIVILMGKSAVTLAAMFGAVYAGCFYAVIDPEQPAKRVQEMFRVLSPELIFRDSLSDVLMEKTAYNGQSVFLKDCLQEEADTEILNQIRKESKDSDILYCMFTSGSTGTPKGIIVSHRSVIDFISHFTETFQITKQDIIGNQAPFDFDVSVKDIFTSVFTGASLILIPQKLFSSPPRLLDYLCNKHVSVLIWAASALALISSLKGLAYRIPSDVKKIMFSGEVMPTRQLRQWQSVLPETEFVNLYGPTEITCNCTYYRIDRMVAEGEKIPIGKPFAGRKVFLADETGKIIRKPEETGEICIAGESLATGYYQMPEETEKRFCKTTDGRIYYKSGDLGYWGTNDELYYVGRKDFQVKLMGRRIELEEVEFALNQLEGVEKSCCLLNRDPCCLVAYYSGEAEEGSIRRLLRDILPAYMIPKKIIRINQIPLNKNGKTDRAELKELQEALLL